MAAVYTLSYSVWFRLWHSKNLSNFQVISVVLHVSSIWAKFEFFLRK